MKVGDFDRISQNKSIFAKGYVLNWSVEPFVIEKVKNIVPWICDISDINPIPDRVSFYFKAYFHPK